MLCHNSKRPQPCIILALTFSILFTFYYNHHNIREVQIDVQLEKTCAIGYMYMGIPNGGSEYNNNLNVRSTNDKKKQSINLENTE